MNISLPFNKRREGRNAVADEVIGLAEDVQVDLSSVRLQAHDLHLHRACRHYYPPSTPSCSSIVILIWTSPCPWRVSESLRCATPSRWLCTLTERRCSSPRASRRAGSPTDPVNTWSWSAAGRFDGRIPHTEETPWSEARCHPSSEACRRFAVI